MISFTENHITGPQRDVFDAVQDVMRNTELRKKSSWVNTPIKQGRGFYFHLRNAGRGEVTSASEKFMPGAAIELRPNAEIIYSLGLGAPNFIEVVLWGLDDRFMSALQEAEIVTGPTTFMRVTESGTRRTSSALIPPAVAAALIRILNTEEDITSPTEEMMRIVYNSAPTFTAAIGNKINGGSLHELVQIYRSWGQDNDITFEGNQVRLPKVLAEILRKSLLAEMGITTLEDADVTLRFPNNRGTDRFGYRTDRYSKATFTSIRDIDMERKEGGRFLIQHRSIDGTTLETWGTSGHDRNIISR
ncbi:hypothetical protein H6802_02750 [Candidatus Nomurabacteria bacterium]|nr:hypothetical protein [Candidatus Nomurabacteria bacterium]MCB9827166.1 hypothetical protein [Candidatus Nomurabacteria bacterium]MCB9827793.1 hypothetical protein [Candidatus Nomurabacteria bacterium]